MSLFSIEPPESKINDRKTNRDRFETAVAHTGPHIIHTTLERETTYETSAARGDLEKAMPEKASDSPDVVNVSTGQDVPNKSSGGNLLEVKGDDIEYPSGIRLLLLTFGLMAVVLMVALDNYILGPLIVTSLL